MNITNQRLLCALLVSITISFQSHVAWGAEGAFDDVFTIAVYGPVPSKRSGITAIFNHIIEEADAELELISLPPKRMLSSLQARTVEGFYTSDINDFDKMDLIRSKFPVSVTKFSAYFHESSAWRPSWPLNDGFRQAVGVTVNLGFLNGEAGMNIEQVGDFRAGIMMVNAKRADYFIDALYRGSTLLADIFGKESDGYLLEEVFISPLYFYFLDDDNGRRIRNILDTGMEKMFKDQDVMNELFHQNEPLEIEILVFNRFKKYVSEHILSGSDAGLQAQ